VKGFSGEMAGNLWLCTFPSLQDYGKLRFKSNSKLDKTKHAKTQASILSLLKWASFYRLGGT